MCVWEVALETDNSGVALFIRFHLKQLDLPFSRDSSAARLERSSGEGRPNGSIVLNFADAL